MQTTRAIVVDPTSEGRLIISEVPAPQPRDDEAVIRVEATSLNPGEVQVAMAQTEAGWRPGRDFVGTVVRAAANRNGPSVGARVVGLRLASAAWAQEIAVGTESLTELPDGVSSAAAAALPVAGLTALHALARGGFLLGRRVLITGSTGAVGSLAHQLVAVSGAYGVGTARRPDDAARVRGFGAEHVVIGADLSAAAEYGPYDLILDSLGGEALAAELRLIAPGGSCVNIGWSAGQSSEIDVMALNRSGASVSGLRLDFELRTRDAGPDLATLAALVADGRLVPEIGVEASWTEFARIADDLIHRRFAGKAILHF